MFMLKSPAKGTARFIRATSDYKKNEFTNKKSLKPRQPSVNQVSVRDPAFLAMIQFPL